MEVHETCHKFVRWLCGCCAAYRRCQKRTKTYVECKYKLIEIGKKENELRVQCPLCWTPKLQHSPCSTHLFAPLCFVASRGPQEYKRNRGHLSRDTMKLIILFAALDYRFRSWFCINSPWLAMNNILKLWWNCLEWLFAQRSTVHDILPLK